MKTNTYILRLSVLPHVAEQTADSHLASGPLLAEGAISGTQGMTKKKFVLGTGKRHLFEYREEYCGKELQNN